MNVSTDVRGLRCDRLAKWAWPNPDKTMDWWLEAEHNGMQRRNYNHGIQNDSNHAHVLWSNVWAITCPACVYSSPPESVLITVLSTQLSESSVSMTLAVTLFRVKQPQNEDKLSVASRFSSPKACMVRSDEINLVSENMEANREGWDFHNQPKFLKSTIKPFDKFIVLGYNSIKLAFQNSVPRSEVDQAREARLRQRQCTATGYLHSGLGSGTSRCLVLDRPKIYL
ncbi:hypothetical protein RRG08_050795 [Elysia crispata]|uniref:Uncharacterized protein n=1 Tax=Elysia crispata TaxID=231223 RepID=A0AAE0YGM1_9GAST|nr:hypothetical protein RRG08_050795 [Elysia crispata]